MKRTLHTILILSLLFILSACGSRLPSAKRSHHLTQDFFEKYGNKYKESDLGSSRVSKVEIGDIKEMQKNLASVEAYVYQENGSVNWVRLTCLKKTFGWKVLNWESLGKK